MKTLRITRKKSWIGIAVPMTIYLDDQIIIKNLSSGKQITVNLENHMNPVLKAVYFNNYTECVTRFDLDPNRDLEEVIIKPTFHFLYGIHFIAMKEMIS